MQGTKESVSNIRGEVAAIASVLAGLACGAGTYLICGPEVGTEVGIGITGFLGGALFGQRSADRAVQLEKEGKLFHG